MFSQKILQFYILHLQLIFELDFIKVWGCSQDSFLAYNYPSSYRVDFAPLIKTKQTKLRVPILVLDRKDFRGRKVSEITNSITQR